MGGGALTAVGMLALALSGPSTGKAQGRRLSGIKERHGEGTTGFESQMRKAIASRPTANSASLQRLIPNRAALEARLKMTGKNWNASKYMSLTGGILAVIAALLMLKGAPIYLAVMLGAAMGLAIPHFLVGMQINKRRNNFVVKFPEAIELMVRGLRSGLPIAETLGIVGSEIPGAVGEEFRSISDKIKIGRTMDEALAEAGERMGMPEFDFFGITIAIQRETGGNLAETLSNLADVLRKRAQMKLKIKAMSSESKASAYIIGALPFIVFGLVWMMNPVYLGGFFSDQRLMIAGVGGMVWMSIGAFIMAKMINFEI
jgi:tight adherence protein B